MVERDERTRRDLSAGADVSDLIGVKETLLLGVWLVAAILCFFLVSVVLGIIVVIVGAVGAIALGANAVRRADISD